MAHQTRKIYFDSSVSSVNLCHFLPEINDAFTLFDKKGDGMISCNQIGEILRALGLNPLASEIKKLEKEIDPEGELRTITVFCC